MPKQAYRRGANLAFYHFFVHFMHGERVMVGDDGVRRTETDETDGIGMRVI